MGARRAVAQAAKVLLAFGLATQAKLVLLDEPMNGLTHPSVCFGVIRRSG
jgi:ABC-type branched-subunit amino acid transport system ATPase component